MNLKPCPFCGAAPSYTPRTESAAHPGNFWGETIKCKPCNLTFITGMYGCKDSVEHWNARAPSAIEALLTPSAWQPINTAPKNGTAILVCTAGIKGSAGEAHFTHGEWFCMDVVTSQPDIMVSPTHWMPLPNVMVTPEGQYVRDHDPYLDGP